MLRVMTSEQFSELKREVRQAAARKAAKTRKRKNTRAKKECRELERLYSLPDTRS